VTDRSEVGSRSDGKGLTCIYVLCEFQNVAQLLQWCVYEDIVSFLSNLVIMQESPQEETANGVEGGRKKVKEEICQKIEEENKNHEEIEEVDEEGKEEEEEEEDNGDEVEDLEDEEEVEEEEEEVNEEKKNNDWAEGRGEMESRQHRGTDEAKKTDHDDSNKQNGFSTSPKNKNISDTDTEKVKVSCAEGSSTWNKLLNEFNALMKSLNNVNEVSQLVQLLQSMHSIISCASEVVVLLESSRHWPPDETPFIFTFFEDNFGDMIRFLIQVLSSSCEEDGGECVILICLEMVGTILHMPEAHDASQQDIEAAVTLLSLPWHKQVPPGSDMNCSLSHVSRLTGLSSKFSHYLNDVNK
jgi:hypothetical protein